MSKLEARCHPRRPASLHATLEGSVLSDELTDISLGGFRLTTSRPLERGLKVSCRIDVPHYNVPLHLLGTVVWADGDHAGVKVTPAELSHTDRARLAELVEKLAKDAERL